MKHTDRHAPDCACFWCRYDFANRDEVHAAACELAIAKRMTYARLSGDLMYQLCYGVPSKDIADKMLALYHECERLAAEAKHRPAECNDFEAWLRQVDADMRQHHHIGIEDLLMDFDWRRWYAEGYTPHHAVVSAIYEQGGTHLPLPPNDHSLHDEAKS
jgi:hypothetical protein